MATAEQVIAGRYRLGRLLGSGGMGAVYLAEDLRLRRQVAIKICSTRTMTPDEAQEAAELFQSEALTLARLHHPGLTAVWDYFNQDDEWYLVMEYVPGLTLREVLAQNAGRVPRPKVLAYTGQLCDVLNYLHSQQPPVVFRDLKPSNVMVTPDDTLKLIDFGIARLFSPDKHADTAQFGTPGYAPPEQYGGQTEPRSDVYSLGVLAHQMLTGHNPGGSAFVVPPARAVDPTTPEAAEEVLQRATAHAPTDRFPTVADFCVALRRALDPTNPIVRPVAPNPAPVPATPTVDPVSRPLWTPTPRTLPTKPADEGGNRGLVIMLLVLILFGSLGGGIWLLRNHIPAVLESLNLNTGVSPTTPLVPGSLVYVAPGGNGDDLWLRVSGGKAQQLTTVAAGTNASLPVLAPNRQEVAYSLTTADGGEQVWLLNLKTKQQRQLLTEYPVARAPSWSPDGATLAVEVATPQNARTADRDIMLVDVANGKVRSFLNQPQWEGGPSWSPDGKQLAFHANYRGCMLIFVADVSGGTSRQVTQPPDQTLCNGGNGDYWPVWSPDGQQLAFGRKFGDKQQIAIVDFLPNSAVTLQTWQTGALAAGHPRWLPDGAHVLFEEGPTNETVLSRLDLKTGEVVTLPDSQGAHLADVR